MDDVPGIGPFQAAQLARMRIVDAEDLVELCGTGDGRRAVADSTGMHPEHLRQWARAAELMQIGGLPPVHVELLLASGVGSIDVLGARTAPELADALVNINAAQRITEAVPSRAEIDEWIRQARSLPSRVYD